MKIKHLFILTILGSLFALGGCTNTNSRSEAGADDTQLQALQAENTSLMDKVKHLTQSLSQKDGELSNTKMQLSAAHNALAGTTKLPSDAGSGDCFGLAGDGVSLLKTICPGSLSPTLIKSVQSALKGAGHNPGPIDGILGSKTMAALNAYQKAKSLMQGGLSMETVKSLGVM